MAIVALLYCVMCMCCVEEMITDIQLAIFANVLGVSLFLLVVLYHYISVNNPKKSD